MATGIVLQLTHTGTIDSSLYLSDLDKGTDGPAGYRKSGPLYVRKNQTVDLLYTTDVIRSYENGVIKQFITAGYLTAELVIVPLASTSGAESIGYDNTTSGLVADNVQEAIDALVFGGASQQVENIYFLDSGLDEDTAVRRYQTMADLLVDAENLAPGAPVIVHVAEGDYTWNGTGLGPRNVYVIGVGDAKANVTFNLSGNNPVVSSAIRVGFENLTIEFDPDPTEFKAGQNLTYLFKNCSVPSGSLWELDPGAGGTARMEFTDCTFSGSTLFYTASGTGTRHTYVSFDRCTFNDIESVFFDAVTGFNTTDTLICTDCIFTATEPAPYTMFEGRSTFAPTLRRCTFNLDLTSSLTLFSTAAGTYPIVWEDVTFLLLMNESLLDICGPTNTDARYSGIPSSVKFFDKFGSTFPLNAPYGSVLYTNSDLPNFYEWSSHEWVVNSDGYWITSDGKFLLGGASSASGTTTLILQGNYDAVGATSLDYIPLPSFASSACQYRVLGDVTGFANNTANSAAYTLDYVVVVDTDDTVTVLGGSTTTVFENPAGFAFALNPYDAGPGVQLEVTQDATPATDVSWTARITVYRVFPV